MFSAEPFESPSFAPFFGRLVSRNVRIGRHRTSIRLEPAMWSGFEEICRREQASVHGICTWIDAQISDAASLTTAVRVFILNYFFMAATEEGHRMAGHGAGALKKAISGAAAEKTQAPDLDLCG